MLAARGERELPATLNALLIALVTLLPGSVHTWAFERATGKSDHQAGDRIPHLIAASAIYLVLWSPAIPIFASIAKSTSAGSAAPVAHYAIAVALLIVLPLIVGSAAGAATVRRHRTGALGWIGRRIGGPGHASRAWDYLFATKDLIGTIRVILTDNSTIIGTWARSETIGAIGEPPPLSYASGFPGTDRDLYISKVLEIRYPDGSIQKPGGTVLIPAQSIHYLEFYPNQPTET